MQAHQRTGMKHFYVAIFFFVVLVIMLCSGGSAHGQVKKDSIPKWEKVVVIKVPVESFQPITDSIGLVINQLGKAMTVDAAEEWKSFFRKQFSRFMSNVKLDSVIVKLK